MDEGGIKMTEEEKKKKRNIDNEIRKNMDEGVPRDEL